MFGLHFIHPGDLSTRTGGYRYARSLLAALGRRGIAAEVHRLADSFPFPDERALAHAARVLARIADASPVVVDGLAFGAMPQLAAAHAARLRLIALVHHPLALETGLAAAQSARLAASERAALACARAVIVTSPATAAALHRYGVAPSRITIALPGTDRAALKDIGKAREPLDDDGAARPVELLCVASITPRKGHLDLVRALAACRARQPRLPWRLVCVGSLERDPDCVAALRAAIEAHGLAAQVTLAGERDEAGVDRAYQDADVFVLASYHEGYGMVLAEAISHGLPVVSTTAGAIPDTVPEGAGRLVAPGDVDSLAAALQALIGQAALRRTMAAAARKAAHGLPNWDQAAARVLGVLQGLEETSPAVPAEPPGVRRFEG
jgi:glycosyltransferase involved in cell wall biosynthesis